MVKLSAACSARNTVAWGNYASLQRDTQVPVGKQHKQVGNFRVPLARRRSHPAARGV